MNNRKQKHVNKMFQENNDIESNVENIKVWRYMDIPKLVSILDKSALFFVRSDKLSDPSEGLLTKASVKGWDSLLEEVHAEDPSKGFVESIINYAKRIPEKSRLFTYVNCWHVNDKESMLMWSVYANNNMGVSIQSNLKKLKECLQKSQCYYNEEFVDSPKIYTNEVKYVDVNTFIEDCSDPNWNRNNFFKKPDCFEDEKEFRALIDLSPAIFDRLEEKCGFDYLKVIENNGIYAKVPINILIEKIYVCPLAPDWIFNVVKSIANKYGIGEEKVVKSNLVTGEFK